MDVVAVITNTLGSLVAIAIALFGWRHANGQQRDIARGEFERLRRSAWGQWAAAMREMCFAQIAHDVHNAQLSSWRTLAQEKHEEGHQFDPEQVRTRERAYEQADEQRRSWLAARAALESAMSQIMVLEPGEQFRTRADTITEITLGRAGDLVEEPQTPGRAERMKAMRERTMVLAREASRASWICERPARVHPRSDDSAPQSSSATDPSLAGRARDETLPR